MAAKAAKAPVTSAYSLYALGLLAFINLLNYLDRNVIFALFEPIKHDLHLTDSQLGWLGSAYILVFSIAALPFGLLSDLRSRRAVIAWGVGLWSMFTVASGLVRSFGQLFTCRAAVGIGEERDLLGLGGGEEALSRLEVVEVDAHEGSSPSRRRRVR